jgi:hypothetical protein
MAGGGTKKKGWRETSEASCRSSEVGGVGKGNEFGMALHGMERGEG